MRIKLHGMGQISVVNGEFMFTYAEFKEQIKWPKWDVLEVTKYLLGAQEEYNWCIGKRFRAEMNRKIL